MRAFTIIVMMSLRPGANLCVWAQDAPKPADDLSAIEGRVLNSTTGEPVGKAVVSVQNIDPALSGAQAPAVSTDAAGVFAIQELQPGTYRLTVERNGFVTTHYGAGGSSLPGIPMSLTKGQVAKDVVVRMLPQGIVTGLIVDEDGDPLPGVQIELLRFHYSSQGRKQLQSDGAAETNDLGEYRASGIAPGKYYLLATRRSDAPTTGRAGPSTKAKQGYAPLYYPGVMDLASAAMVEVSSATQLRLDLTLKKAGTVRLSGHVENAVDPGSPVTVSLSSRNATSKPGNSFTGVPDASGNFEIAGVTPGSYWLIASSRPPGNNKGALPVAVTNGDIDNLNLRIVPGARVSAHVVFEGTPPAQVKDVVFQMQPRDISATPFPSSYQSRVTEDGTMAMMDVAPNTYDLVATTPAGFYVKSIRASQADALNPGIVVGEGPVELEVVVSSSVGQVQGVVQVVQNGESQASAGAVVVLLPQEKARRALPIFVRSAAGDQNGFFSFGNVVPGDYQAYAWDNVEPGIWMDPDFMMPLESKGLAVTVAENDLQVLHLTPLTEQ